ncbi:MAG: LegC family aminotransferase [Cytophagaceae bacterium]|nr:LegC family aminotransferase [Cytophagaceae bacterium]
MFEDIISFIRKTFNAPEGNIPLHQPRFAGNEKKYLEQTIDSTFVSSVGEFVNLFEKKICEYTGSKHAIAVSNGTSALHIALQVCGVGRGDVVITQPLTFVATCNAISYLGAAPYFIDIDRKTLGLSYQGIVEFLESKVEMREGYSYVKSLNKKIAACVPMHTFGHPAEIDKITAICNMYNIPIVEDAAESIGSYYKETHTGTFGRAGVFSFNGNKTITCGGGGAIITDDSALAMRAKHLTTQAKIAHPWNFVHDEIGFNYRMPNLNAALAVAQLEQLDLFIHNKRTLAEEYKIFFDKKGIEYVREPENSKSNYWLNSILFDNKQSRDLFLKESNEAGIMTRPAWTLMTKLSMFKECPKEKIDCAEYIEDRLVNLPSSVRI